ncbi:uncharacterized protein N7477_004936 [Penicillium maclennaniae]|uniref:uncharacterized protein n=1 Tax=Penicillium maclennaniae TaxID=1343394 RepID=UPI0025424668|nr:uncharacterized protein N7477_004936 [Penicillium maclennaniae]KAJ5675002.1 hypothetical protein N7477_004936 [Penicillium maclennaniae]
MPEIVNPSPEFLAEQEKRLREWEEENYKQLKDYFDKKDDPLGDDSEQVKAIVSGVLTIAALAVYLTGPAGTAIGVALSTSAAIATAFQKPKANDDVNTVLESIKTLQKNEKIMKHMGATDAFYKWVRDNQHILNSVEHHQEASMKVGDELVAWCETSGRNMLIRE